MKCKEGFVMTEAIADEYIIVPVGEQNQDMHRVIQLNETAAKIYCDIEKGLDITKIIDEFVAEYGLTKEKAENDVNATIKKLADAGVIEL